MITDAAKTIASLAGKRIDLPLGKPSFQPADRYRAFEFDSGNFKSGKPDTRKT